MCSLNADQSPPDELSRGFDVISPGGSQLYTTSNFCPKFVLEPGWFRTPGIHLEAVDCEDSRIVGARAGD